MKQFCCNLYLYSNKLFHIALLRVLKFSSVEALVPVYFKWRGQSLCSPVAGYVSVAVRPCSSVGRVTVDLIRRSWVRFPPRSKDFFFASCGSLFPFTRANAQWVIHGFKVALNLHFRVNSLVPLFVFPVLRGTTFICTHTSSSPRFTIPLDRPRLSLCDLVAQSAEWR